MTCCGGWRRLPRPGVDGVLGTADIVEDLLLIGALDGKVVIGSMNRGGLAGTAFEIDDRFTAYDAAALERRGLQGGKMLPHRSRRRAHRADHAGVRARDRRPCVAGLLAMVEPFISHRIVCVRNDLSAEAVVRSATVAAGLGWTSAHTWLKLPVIDDMEPVLSATNLFRWCSSEARCQQTRKPSSPNGKVLARPQVRGMVVGRSPFIGRWRRRRRSRCRGRDGEGSAP